MKLSMLNSNRGGGRSKGCYIAFLEASVGIGNSSLSVIDTISHDVIDLSSKIPDRFTSRRACKFSRNGLYLFIIDSYNDQQPLTIIRTSDWEVVDWWGDKLPTTEILDISVGHNILAVAGQPQSGSGYIVSFYDLNSGTLLQETQEYNIFSSDNLIIQLTCHENYLITMTSRFTGGYNGFIYDLNSSTELRRIPYSTYAKDIVISPVDENVFVIYGDTTSSTPSQNRDKLTTDLGVTFQNLSQNIDGSSQVFDITGEKIFRTAGGSGGPLPGSRDVYLNGASSSEIPLGRQYYHYLSQVVPDQIVLTRAGLNGIPNGVLQLYDINKDNPFIPYYIQYPSNGTMTDIVAQP